MTDSGTATQNALSDESSGWFDRFLHRAIRKGETEGQWWLLDNLSNEHTTNRNPGCSVCRTG